jgi:hypothetical protein
MKTALIIVALKVPPPQWENCFIVPPEKIGNDDVESPSTDDLTPDSVSRDIKRSHGCECGGVIGIATLSDIHRNHDATSDDAEEDEDVATHLCEPDENGRIQADTVDELGLLGPDDGSDPSKEALSHRRRRVLAVGMFDFGGVDEGMARAKEREEEGQGDGQASGCGQRSPDGVCLELLGSEYIKVGDKRARERTEYAHTADLNGSWRSLRNSSAPSRRRRGL